MGNTVIEKIIAEHTSDEVAPGKLVWIDIDVRSARDFGGANVVKNFRQEYPGSTVADAAKTFFTFDCVAPARDLAYANNQQVCRDFAKEQGIKVFDVDMGIGSHVVMEQGLALPGMIVVGTDSHMNILGAIGSFGQGMGDQDIAFAFKTGRTWFEVPETIRVDVEGSYSPPTSAKDLTLAILGVLKTEKALGKCIEFYGEAIAELSLAGRITLASMATEMGAIAAFIQPGDSVIRFCRERSGRKDFTVFKADKDALYSERVSIDVDVLKPQVSLPGKPDNVRPVSEVAGNKIDSVFIGSCTNGRFEDFLVAADILLKAKKVAPGVMVKVVPSTKEVYGEILKAGLLQTFYSAGVIVSNPGCGGCASGQLGLTGKGETQISTSNRNFAGKQGAGDTYLASPATAAASAVTGRITSPEELR
jgi:3-isopropylmalate/(R)-2-methylmalate dehydratase large subunit